MTNETKNKKPPTGVDLLVDPFAQTEQEDKADAQSNTGHRKGDATDSADACDTNMDIFQKLDDLEKEETTPLATEGVEGVEEEARAPVLAEILEEVQETDFGQENEELSDVYAEGDASLDEEAQNDLLEDLQPMASNIAAQSLETATLRAKQEDEPSAKEREEQGTTPATPVLQGGHVVTHPSSRLFQMEVFGAVAEIPPSKEKPATPTVSTEKSLLKEALLQDLAADLGNKEGRMSLEEQAQKQQEAFKEAYLQAEQEVQLRAEVEIPRIDVDAHMEKSREKRMAPTGKQLDRTKGPIAISIPVAVTPPKASDSKVSDSKASQKEEEQNKESEQSEEEQVFLSQEEQEKIKEESFKDLRLLIKDLFEDKEIDEIFSLDKEIKDFSLQDEQEKAEDAPHDAMDSLTQAKDTHDHDEEHKDHEHKETAHENTHEKMLLITKVQAKNVESQGEGDTNKEQEQEIYIFDEDVFIPILPLRDIVMFPSVVAPLFIGRKSSIHAVTEAMQNSLCNKQVFLVMQKDPTEEQPDANSLHPIGVLAKIVEAVKRQDGTLKILVEAYERAQIVECETHKDGFLMARCAIVPDRLVSKESVDLLRRSIVLQFEDFCRMNQRISMDVAQLIIRIEDPSRLADAIAIQLNASPRAKQELLELVSVERRLLKLGHLIEEDLSVLMIERKIKGQVKRQMEKTQREYFLNEQLKAIQKELGDLDELRDELDELGKKLKELALPDAVRTKATSELKKLKQMSPMSAEATVLRNYLDWIVSLPWNNPKKVDIDLEKAQAILDRDHHGLEKIKERILEYLAVQKRANKLKGPILCLVGPPGVGKTSLGKSIAEATGRDYVRLALGGVHDEAEIRGHRRTYIGAMPGKILQAMKRSSHSNPLLLLDELDKLGHDHRGDPASALLEVLDREQNAAFSDHYLEVDYDLSDVMFVATANTMDIPPALMDRLEIIRLSGYTEEEKVQIAKNHLYPKELENHSLSPSEFTIDDDAYLALIRTYTREAGVRSLERHLASLARKSLKKILSSHEKQVHITKKNLKDFLGPQKYMYGKAEKKSQVGLVVGLAWTEVGGELLTIEALMTPGKGKMTVTGNLKDIMKESISAANSYVRGRAIAFGIDPEIFDNIDIHVHVPEGATPKDGPSAGIGMVTAIVSILKGIPVRRDLAMTGEVTLRGRVLPIGGLKEKLLAALRGNIKKVLLPKENMRDLEEMPKSLLSKLEIVPVETVDEVLQHALITSPFAGFPMTAREFLPARKRHRVSTIQRVARLQQKRLQNSTQQSAKPAAAPKPAKQRILVPEE